jgi:hypothetical protein
VNDLAGGAPRRTGRRAPCPRVGVSAAAPASSPPDRSPSR